MKTAAALTDVFIGASALAGAATVYFGVAGSGSSEAPKQKAAGLGSLKLSTGGSALILSGKF